MVSEGTSQESADLPGIRHVEVVEISYPHTSLFFHMVNGIKEVVHLHICIRKKTEQISFFDIFV